MSVYQFFFKPPHNVFLGPKIVLCSGLMQIRLRAAEIRPFLGRIWSVLNPCKMEEQVWKVQFVCFSVFFIKSPENVSLAPKIVVHGGWMQTGLRAAKILPFLGRMWSVFDPSEMERNMEILVHFFSFFFIELTQNVSLGPKIVVNGGLTQIELQSAKIWPFLGRIWNVFDPCEMEEKVWKVQFIFFSYFLSNHPRIFLLDQK